MKILHVYNHFIPCIGGIENQIDGLCRNLNRLGHDSDVVCLNTCSNSRDKLPKFGEYNGIKVYRLQYLNLRFYKIAPSVLKLVKDYDIIHVHGLGFFSDFLALTKFLHKKPLVLSTHGGIFHTKSLRLLKKIYFGIWCRFSLKKFDQIIAVSKKDLELFSKISSKVVFISNAVDIRDFANLKRETEENSFLFVGRISKNKLVDNLINTFYFLKKKLPDLKLYIVGEDWGGIKKKLEKLVREKGLNEHVIFTGGIKEKGELYSYYSKAEFFVSASEYEGFGISVLESMAAGLVTIVNDIDVFQELIKDDENGFLVDYSNPESSSKHILEIMRKDLMKIKENAKATACRYDWETSVKEFEKLYEGAR